MAGKHRLGQRVQGSTGRTRDAHNAKPPHSQPYEWLGVGAVTLGLGVALADGTGIAHADERPRQQRFWDSTVGLALSLSAGMIGAELVLASVWIALLDR